MSDKNQERLFCAIAFVFMVVIGGFGIRVYNYHASFNIPTPQTRIRHENAWLQYMPMGKSGIWIPHPARDVKERLWKNDNGAFMWKVE